MKKVKEMIFGATARQTEMERIQNIKKVYIQFKDGIIRSFVRHTGGVHNKYSEGWGKLKK